MAEQNRCLLSNKIVMGSNYGKACIVNAGLQGREVILESLLNSVPPAFLKINK